ncbi:hypothetical protein [Halobacillus aidingensis]|uniref:Uncharacterized protein n=1 Tax=Halobacillus aidingensis TaxID=240303 RepID=A0A1H0S8R7_HALAD|nr:hypothetical protein [Halobacillus aidingensis]SDP38134.1 hypothetical protein SAMN05421677_11768 [Halobacillus aidingensis]
MSEIKFWEGKEWQNHIEKLLKLHYPLGDYVPIPDKDGGDKGIEGFSRDGRCFQCYAAEEPLTIEELYNKQRRKISNDIKKFKNNQKELSSFFGPTKITRWIFVVPRHETNKIVAHAEKKLKK